MPLIDRRVTRFEDGLTNVPLGSLFNSFKTMNPLRYHTFFNDFDTYLASDWIVTDVGAGNSQGLISGEGGILRLVTDSNDDDSSFLQSNIRAWGFEDNKPLFFQARLNIDNAVESDFVCGIQSTDTTPLSVANGVWFQKDDGDDELDMHTARSSTQFDENNIFTVPASDNFVIAFFWDGISRFYYGAGIGEEPEPLGFMEPGTGGYPSAGNQNTISFGIQNGSAQARQILIDYIFVATERSNL